MTAKLPLRIALFIALSLGVPTAVQNAARAQGEANVANAGRDPAVMMQRFMVSATRIEKNPWRYGSIPGFEVLSRASDEKMYWMLAAYYYEMMIEKALLPADWLPQPSVPYILIVDDTDVDAAPGGPIHSHPLNFQSPADALAWGGVNTSISYDAVASGDRDTEAINSNLNGVDTHGPNFASIAMDRVGYCTPALPNWLIAGLTGGGGVFREPFIGAANAGREFTSLFESINGVIGPGTLWGSIDNTQRLLQEMEKDNSAKIALRPLRYLFSESSAFDENDPLMESEAALFVRWGLFGRPGHKDPAMSRAFLEFVRRARREPVTEQMFSDCFGFGYVAMEERLANFLGYVIARPTSVPLDLSLRLPRPDMKAATADQIGRVLGDWLRMKGDSLAGEDPELSKRFLSTAGQMLLRAYKDDNGLPPDVDPSSGGKRSADPSRNSAFGRPVALKPFVVTASRIHDPGLLAVYGLYEHDIGDDGKAREFLEAAVKAGVVRPQAWIALARIRYEDASDKPLGAEGKLSVQQTASILEPLLTGLRASPDPELYGLILDVWRQSEGKPADQDIDELVKGVTLFPRNSDLAYRAATFCAHSGYAGRAGELIDKALVFTTDEDDRKGLEELRSSLGLLPAPGLR